MFWLRLRLGYPHLCVAGLTLQQLHEEFETKMLAVVRDTSRASVNTWNPFNAHGKQRVYHHSHLYSTNDVCMSVPVHNCYHLRSTSRLHTTLRKSTVYTCAEIEQRVVPLLFHTFITISRVFPDAPYCSGTARRITYTLVAFTNDPYCSRRCTTHH
jgi:hypothetical protein